MEIIYLGHSAFKLKGRTSSIVCDPFDPKTVGIKFPPVSSEIVTISHNHDDHNRADLVKETRKIIDSPGEYEISGISILGIKTYHDNQKGTKRGSNCIYVFEIDEIRIAHLGDLGYTLSENTIEEMGDIDILIIPVGGFYTIGPKEASEIVQDVEPSITIPMHFYSKGLNEEMFGKLEPVDAFLKETGFVVERLPKLSIKKYEIKEEESKIVMLDIRD